jgi:hypothetical protein
LHTTGDFSPLLRPGLSRDFHDSYMNQPEEYSRFLKVGTQTEGEVREMNIAGLPRMVRLAEGEPVPYLDVPKGTPVAFVDDIFGLGFQVSEKLMEDDLYNQANKSSKWLGDSARWTQEHRAAALLDDAFTGATFTGVNGEQLVGTHTLLNGSTFSNLIAGNPPLSVAGLQAAWDIAETMVNEIGEPVIDDYNMLIISAGDAWVATQIAESELEPFTADNTVNAIRRRKGGMSYMISHYKTDTNSWFLQGRNHDMRFLFRRRPRFRDTFDFDSMSAKFAGDQRINVLFFDWRGVVGSNPA